MQTNTLAPSGADYVLSPTSAPLDYSLSAGESARMPTGGQNGTTAPDARIRVVLVDDYPIIRAMTRRVLALHPNMVVVGEAGDGAAALDVVAQVQPDVVLMDVYMPILDGVATTQRLRATYPDLPIVLFTSSEHDGYVLEGVRAGAVGYLLKTAAGAEVVATLRAAISA